MPKVGAGNAEWRIRRRFWPLLWRHYSQFYRRIFSIKFWNVEQNLIYCLANFEPDMIVFDNFKKMSKTVELSSADDTWPTFQYYMTVLYC